MNRILVFVLMLLLLNLVRECLWIKPGDIDNLKIITPDSFITPHIVRTDSEIDAITKERKDAVSSDAGIQ